jgi:uncharacterized metal-binding protein
MSEFGLICRAISSDLSFENDNIASICLTSTVSASKTPDIIKKYPIIALNGCSNNCVSDILNSKDIPVSKVIDIMTLAKENNLQSGDVARLGDEGEKTVKALKDIILEKI